MSAFAESRAVAVPDTGEHMAVASACGHVLDPDTGGARTFADGGRWPNEESPTHFYAVLPLATEYAAAIDDPDATVFYAGLQALAAECSREFTVTFPQVQALRDAIVLAGTLDEMKAKLAEL
jgi:hypothetical protein